MQKKLLFEQFEVLNQDSDQVRLNIPCLFNNKERSAILQTILLKRETITAVNFNLANNEVIIDYDSTSFQADQLFMLLTVVLENFSKIPPTTPQQSADDNKSKKQQFSFTVDGMNCLSCALFIEMILSRNPDVISAEIDFDRKTGFVSGYLTKQQVFSIIEKNGFAVSDIN